MKESENQDKYLELVKELKNYEHEIDSDTNCNWCARYSHKWLEHGMEDLEIKGQVEIFQIIA